MKRFDLFGAQLPTYNVKGKTEVRTTTGSICSILIIGLVIAYSILKLENMLTKKNPVLRTRKSPVGSDARYDVRDSDFMVAFAVEHWLSGWKDDLRYIQWVVNEIVYIDNVEAKFLFHSTHRCTDEEFARFYPVSDDAATKVANLQANG